MTRIEYQALPGDRDWLQEVTAMIGHLQALRIADLGGGAKPILDTEFIEARGLDYTVFDISGAELARAGPEYKTVAADIGSPEFAQGLSFDLVLSRWVLEHIENPAQVHKNVFSMLSEGGVAMHFFPTLYAPPFVLNRMLPEWLSTRLIGRSLSHRSKFPALYRWCRGPSASQLRRLRAVGFEVDEYVGFYGHPYYARSRWLDAAQRRVATMLAARPVPQLTSFASVTLRRPIAASHLTDRAGRE